MEQLATFHTHLGALRLKKKLDSLGDATAVMMPVPRKLSASCGTCVRFELPFDPAWADEDLAGVYVREGSGFRAIFLNQSED